MAKYEENLFENASGKQFEFGRALRQDSTPAEFVLWEKLRGNRLAGFKFRRQHPIDKYIADFYCHEARLVVEVDGGIHDVKMNREYDIERGYELDKLGITTIRFTNADVIGDMVNVLEVIKRYLTSPQPSPEGEGEKTLPPNLQIKNTESENTSSEKSLSSRRGI